MNPFFVTTNDAGPMQQALAVTPGAAALVPPSGPARPTRGVLVGGTGTLVGALYGSALLTVLKSVVGSFTAHHAIVIGALSWILVAEQFGDTDPFSGSTGWVERYGDQEVSQFRGADMIAEKWGLSRTYLDEMAVTSHERAAAQFDALLRARRGGAGHGLAAHHRTDRG